jgi:hypothetical protein
MMFGLGGQARGYGWFETWHYANMFNISQVENFYSPDGRGTWPGYAIGISHAFRNRTAFCSIINGLRIFNYNDGDTLETVSQCTACTTNSVTHFHNKFTGNPPPDNPTSLRRLSDNVPTKADLEEKVGDVIKMLWNRLAR